MHQDCCFFEVPEYIYGLPSFDVKKCTMYIMMVLRQRGFVCEYHPQITKEGKKIPVLFISWNIRKTKKQTQLLLGGPNSNIRDDSYVFEKHNTIKQYVFEKPKIEPQMTNLIMAPNSNFNRSKPKKYRKVKPLRPKKEKRTDFSNSELEHDKVIDYNPNSALSGLKLRAELIRQKNKNGK